MSDAATGTPPPVFEYLLRLADDRLVLGHRISEWCGHAPVLEEDIALANISLDLIGQATYLLGLAGTVEGKNRTADDLAFWRVITAYRNLLLVEQENGDFAVTMARQFLFDAYSVELLAGIAAGKDAQLAAIAAKALKEDLYHLRHSRQWILRLGDGTEESHRRVQAGFDDLWMYTAELFAADDLDTAMAAAGVAPALPAVRAAWEHTVADTLKEATLVRPDDKRWMATGGRKGRHTEALGTMLDLMQILPRSHPGAAW